MAGRRPNRCTDAPTPPADTAAERAALATLLAAGAEDALAIGVTRRLLLVARRYRKVLDGALHAAGHSQAGWEVLFALALKGGESTLTEVADRLGLEGATLVGPIARLEARGFLSRTLDPGDRRSRRIRLTEAGRHAVAEMRDISSAERGRFLDGVPADDLATTFRVLTLMRDNLHRRGLARG